MIQKKYVVALATLAVVGGSILTMNQVRAFGFNQDGTMIQQLATKLGKSESEVQTAFEAVRQEHQNTVNVDYEAMLAEAVTSGELTSQQQELLLNKRQEIEQNREARRGEMMAQHDEMVAWANENGIKEEFVFGIGRRDDRGPRNGSGMGFGAKNIQQ